MSDTHVTPSTAQGTPTETVIPPSFGTAYHEPNLYPHDVAKASSWCSRPARSGRRQIWTTNADPAPKAAQYLASVLGSIGLKVTGVRTIDDSVYWDTLLSEKTDPQIAFNHFDQDYPEGEDFIDTLLNGEHIVPVGNNDVSNTDDPTLNSMTDRTDRMPLDAGWAPFMHLEEPKFVSPDLHGLVFTGSYFELIPEMWLSK